MREISKQKKHFLCFGFPSAAFSYEKLVQKSGKTKRKNLFFLRYYDFNHYLCTIFPTNTVNKDET
jgi:hypothetical protein